MAAAAAAAATSTAEIHSRKTGPGPQPTGCGRPSLGGDHFHTMDTMNARERRACHGEVVRKTSGSVCGD